MTDKSNSQPANPVNSTTAALTELLAFVETLEHGRYYQTGQIWEVIDAMRDEIRRQIATHADDRQSNQPNG